MGRALRFSIVVPMRDEAGAVQPLAEEIASACAALGPFEAIFVDDASTDDTAARIRAARAAFPWLRGLHHARASGQSAALRTGILAARAPLIVTLDGDGQNPPAEIPRLLAPLLGPEPRPALVAGERRQRADEPARRLLSSLANALRRALLGDGARDSACGLKAFPREVFLALPYFDHMHRFLPALVRREGLEVTFIEVEHRPRMAGLSKYGTLPRALAGAVDLPGVWWLLRRRRLPGGVDEDP